MAPNLLVRLYTVSKALAKAVWQLLLFRSPFVSARTLAIRIDTCHNCEFRAGMSCTICGCIIEAKARLKSEQCPVNEWP